VAVAQVGDGELYMPTQVFGLGRKVLFAAAKKFY
jgi:hypothetical protein